MVAQSRPYDAMVPILADALQRAGARQVLDLCSGAGGPWFWLQQQLAERGLTVKVCLTDKFPNAEELNKSGNLTSQAISFHPHPLDATRVPDELTGFRTLFGSFHHFHPVEARALLADAVRRREGIAIFEASHRGAQGLSLALLVPVMVLLTTPFIRPFHWSRLFWTYLLPVVPLDCAFGWAASCLRTYTVPELRELTEGLGATNYQWDIGDVQNTAGPIPITYLIGLPPGSHQSP